VAGKKWVVEVAHHGDLGGDELFDAMARAMDKLSDEVDQIDSGRSAWDVSVYADDGSKVASMCWSCEPDDAAQEETGITAEHTP
jgi:hypothetical protein